MEYLKNCLTQDSFWQVNKRVLKEVGIESAVVLTDLIDKYYYFKDRKATLIRNECHWFFYTSSSIEDTFKIAYKVQKRILQDLEKRGLITTKLFGSPAKLHITICEKPIALLLNSRFAETEELDVPKEQIQIVPNGNTIYNNINNNKSLTKVKDSTSPKSEDSSKRFVIPSVEELKEYFIARSAPAGEDERFFDFYTSKGWYVGKNKMKDWKAAVRNWMRGVEKDKPKEVSQKISF